MTIVVMGQDGLGLGLIGTQAFPDDLFSVIVADNEGASAVVTTPGYMGSPGENIKHRPAILALATANDAADQNLSRDVQMDYNRRLQASGCEFSVQKLGLAESPRVAIKHETIGAIRLADPVSHDPIDDLIANEASGSNDCLRFQPQCRTSRYLATQHFASGNRGNRGRQPFDDHAPLRSFAGTRGAKEENNQTSFMIC